MWVSWSPDVSQGHRKAHRSAGPRSGRAPAAGVYAGRERRTRFTGRSAGRTTRRPRDPASAASMTALEGRLATLLEENALLRAELRALKHRFGLCRHGGTRTLPTLLWDSPWPGDSSPRADQTLTLPGSHGCLLRPCSLDAGGSRLLALPSGSQVD